MVSSFLLVLGLLCIAATAEPNKKRYWANNVDGIREDARLTAMGLLEKYGYNAEEHRVETEDGYILEVHRILPSRQCGEKQRGPLLLQHGLISSSSDWIIMGPDKGLGYVLSDACYDVWMGNSRGNTYSRRHKRFSVNSKAFWNFSWHEMGLYDLPAVIDYILQNTSQSAVYYVGHSQGNTQFFVLDSLRPEYSKKIRVAINLSPPTSLKDCKSSILQFIGDNEKLIEYATDAVGIYSVFQEDNVVRKIGTALCSIKHPDILNICENIAYSFGGYDFAETNVTMIPAILGHAPAGSSFKQFAHYAQSISKARWQFKQFDYGAIGNQKRYKRATPPDYPLYKSKTPTVLFYSENDFLVSIRTVEKLAKSLGNCIGKYLVPIKAFNHFDYLFGIHAKNAVYDQVVRILSQH